jgi:hypothetical protein
LASRESFFLAARLIVGLVALTVALGLVGGAAPFRAWRYAAIAASRARSSAATAFLFSKNSSITALICFLQD